MKTYVIILFHETETLLLGELLSKYCVVGSIIYLKGDIGSGKSVICRGFLKGMGCINNIKSPTYTIIESYSISSVCMIHHFDLYRVVVEEELEYIGIRDYFNAESICLVEWPERGINILPKEDMLVSVNYYNHSERSRKIALQPISKLGKAIICNLLSFGMFMYAVEI